MMVAFIIAYHIKKRKDTFIYNDKTMDLMRVAEGRTYSVHEKIVGAKYKGSGSSWNNNSYKRPSVTRSNSNSKSCNKYGTKQINSASLNSISTVRQILI